MDALRRNQYLQTMGVDVWVSRHPPASATAAAAATAAAGAADPHAAEVAAVHAAQLHAGVASASQAVAAPATAVASAAQAAVAQPVAAAASAARAAVAQPATAVASAAKAAVPHNPGAPARSSGDAFDSPARPAPDVRPAVAPGADVLPAVARFADAPPAVTTWESLRSEVLACTRCPLHGSRTQGVFGVGSREAQWLVVGEAPGAEEDRRGEPFVGRAGHLLDAMLKAIGLSRGSNVYIANVLKSRPPGNRDPKPEEVAACLPYLMRQIELLRPRVMLAVGRIAAQNLLSTDAPLGRLRGKVHHFGELNTPLIVTYHPAYLLRTPSDKRKAWEDLKFARSVFQTLNPT
jgi:DNA polymerase